MAITWSNDVAINYDEMFCVGIDYYILSENSYQATIRADVYISTWLYGSSTYAFWVKIGLHTSTKELWVNLKDGKYQLVKTWDVTVTKSNDSSFNAYCYAIGWTHDLYTNTVGGNLSVAKGYWHYVAYDANGGTGAPASQVKYYGAPIYLSSTAPTRENHDFTGWLNTATGSVIQAGSYYGYDMRGTNTLAAQWQIIHKPPSVAIQQPYRVASADATEAISLGTYVRAPVTWACDQTGYETVECASVTATVIADDSSEVTDVAVSGTITGAAGTAYVVFPLATTSHASVSVTVTETATPASGDAVTYQAVSTAYVGKANVPLDIANKGNSVAILSTAGEEDSITLGSLALTDVSQDTAGTLSMPRLLGFVKALNKCQSMDRLLSLAELMNNSPDDVDWTYLYNESSYGWVRWCCRLGIVYVVASVSKSAAGDWQAGVLPSGYRPACTMSAGADIWGTNNVGLIYVSENGGVVCYWGAGGTLAGSIAFPVN